MQEKRRSDSEKTRTIIYEAAEQLFAEKGFAATSMSQIAKKAEITQSLISHHFGSKKNLWEIIKKIQIKNYLDIQMNLITIDVGDSMIFLESSLIAYFDFIRENPKILRFRLWDQLEKSGTENYQDSFNKEGINVFLQGVEKFKIMQTKGLLRNDISPENIMSSFLIIVDGWFLQRKRLLYLLNKSPDEEIINEMDEKYLRDMMKMFLKGIKK